MMSRVEHETLSPEIARKSRPVPGLAAIAARARSREEAIREAYRSGGYTLTEIGQHFGIHPSTASRIARSASARNKT